jgi:signal transduction histidine kinase/HAMP domain-containing protein
MAALLLLLEGLVLLIFCLDLSQDFQALTVTSRLALALLGAGGCAALARPRLRAYLGGAVRPIAAISAAVFLLGTIGVVVESRSRRIEAGWEAGARDRLEMRARIVQEDFAWFLDEMLRPLETARRDVPEPDAPGAFEALRRARALSRLPADRHGLSIYRPDGALLAWDGNCTRPPGQLFEEAGAGRRPVFGIGGRQAFPRLYAFAAPQEDGTRWVAEFALKPVADSDPRRDLAPRLDFLPRWHVVEPGRLRLRHGRDGDEELRRFFERQGDRYWRRLGKEAVLALSFPLRGPGGDHLAVVSLTDRRVAQAVGAWRRLARQAGAVATTVLLLAGWLLWASRGSTASAAARLVAGTVALWSARAALLLVGDASSLPRLPVYDTTIYAGSGFHGLLRSPADLLLTAVACFAQACLLRLSIRRLEPPEEIRRRDHWRWGALVALSAVLIAGLLGLHQFLDQLALDARIDVSRVETNSFQPARLALQAAILFLAAGLPLLLGALVDLVLRCSERSTIRPVVRWFAGTTPGSLPPIARASAGILLLTVLCVPFLQHAYSKLRLGLVETDLLPLVLHQKEKRREILLSSLAVAREPEFAASARFAEDEQGDGSGDAAYRLWTTTPMAEIGLSSSLQIFDERGDLLSRFAVNLVPTIDVPFTVAEGVGDGDLAEVPPRPEATVRKPVIFGAHWVRAVRRRPLLVVMAVVDHYDNLPLLGAERVYLDLFRARSPSRVNPELMRFEPMVAVFGSGEQPERIYESGGEIPPPSPKVLHRLNRKGIAWITDDLGDGPGRIAYALGPREIVAVAYLLPTLAGVLAGVLRLFLLNGLLCLALFALARGAQWLARPRAPHHLPRATYYGRVMSVFLLSGLVPLLTLAYIVTRITAREFERNVVSSGLDSLQVARRVAEDYLTVGSHEEEPSLDDDVIFYLSRVVRQDINVYARSELLATSTPELYTSGLLNTRLNGEMYRSIYLDREPFRLAKEKVAGLEYLTLNAPMRIDRSGTIGVLSLPLAAHGRAVARKVEEVEDAILIITCSTVLLMAAVGYVMARRVAEPVALLARAAGRVAAGDLDVRVNVTASDETASLVESFNSMAASLRQQREDLSRRKDYIEKILKSATTGVVSIDASGAISTINPAAQNLLAACGPPEVGDNLPDRLGRAPTLEPLRAVLRRALGGKAEREAELVLSEGEAERRLRAVFIPFAPEEGAPPGRIVLLEDVTEIVRSGRLAAFAEMARRVAHEIKNPLTPIQLSVEHVRRLFNAKDPRFGAVLRECLDNIQRQVEVLRQIAFEFSAYARLPQVTPEPTPVEAILDEALGPYAAAPPAGVTLRRSVPPDLPHALIDRAAISRALVNLIENALQAMPGGGTLSVGAIAVPDGAGSARLRIEVRDTGVGIEPSLMPRLFEPYFSTKSGGTGLGLGLARRAVEEQGGSIEIRSRPGQGTVVTLTLPVAAPDRSETRA